MWASRAHDERAHGLSARRAGEINLPRDPGCWAWIAPSRFGHACGEILNETGRLTPEEWIVMQRHTVYGAQLLRHLAGDPRLAMVVAFEHHANYDLSRYPRVTTKERPHLLARIVQIIDSYAAATSSRRIYRRPKTPDEVMRFILKGAGMIYDPALAKAFVHELGVYAVGALVVPDDGALAVVRRPGERAATRP